MGRSAGATAEARQCDDAPRGGQERRVRMSYFRVLGLEREPFSTSPDPAFFYQSKPHRALLANLLIEFRLKRGLSVVLGDIGTGKTTLGRKLVQMLRERPHFVFHMVLDPTYPTEILFFDALSRTLRIDLPRESPSLVDYREALERFLFRKAIEERQTVVLIIDEAHKLNMMSMELLRILLNYETNDAKLLQLVLLGQMELLPILTHMPNLTDRVSLKAQLKPLELDETREMVGFRLREAGYRSSAPLFLDDAIRDIHGHCEGYPRRISMVCHQALRMLVMRDGRAVDRSIVEAVIDQEIDAGWSAEKRLQKSGFSA
ncbi:MAG TPA: AAA family ATPase [bacterium]